MANGDICLDADGNALLDADGNVLLDGGGGCCTCCDTTLACDGTAISKTLNCTVTIVVDNTAAAGICLDNSGGTGILTWDGTSHWTGTIGTFDIDVYCDTCPNDAGVVDGTVWAVHWKTQPDNNCGADCACSTTAAPAPPCDTGWGTYTRAGLRLTGSISKPWPNAITTYLEPMITVS